MIVSKDVTKASFGGMEKESSYSSSTFTVFLSAFPLWTVGRKFPRGVWVAQNLAGIPDLVLLLTLTHYLSQDSIMGDADEDEFFGEGDFSAPVGALHSLNDDSIDTFGGLASAESRALAERFKKIGFHEGYDAAKETKLQEGFEAGYKETFALSKEIGTLLGKMTMKSKLDSNGKIESSLDANLGAGVRSFVRERFTAPNSLCTMDLEDLKRRLENDL
eukprot:scaffold34921_cov162-Amphora_coffeaeformis.AAC.21